MTTDNQDLKEFIKDSSKHLAYSKEEYVKQFEFAKALYFNGTVSISSDNHSYYRAYSSTLFGALTEVENQLEQGRTVAKEKCKISGSALDLFFLKTSQEQDSDLTRIADDVKAKYKEDLASKRFVIIDELTDEYNAKLQQEAAIATQEKMKQAKEQLTSLFEQ